MKNSLQCGYFNRKGSIFYTLIKNINNRKTGLFNIKKHIFYSILSKLYIIFCQNDIFGKIFAIFPIDNTI